MKTKTHVNAGRKLLTLKTLSVTIINPDSMHPMATPPPRL